MNSYVLCALAVECLPLAGAGGHVARHNARAAALEAVGVAQRGSPSAAARCTPAKATSRRPRRPARGGRSCRRGRRAAAAAAARHRWRRRGSAPGKVGRGTRRGTRSRSASCSRGENPCRASGRDEGRACSVVPAPRARSLVRRPGDEPKRRRRSAGSADAPSSRGAAAATVRGPRASAGPEAGARAARAAVQRGGGHGETRVSKCALLTRGSESRDATSSSRPMKTPHSKGSHHDQFSSRCQRSLSVSRRISVSCEEVGISGGGNVPRGTGLRAVRRGWRLPCPRTSRKHRPVAMPSTTRGRVTVRPRARGASFRVSFLHPSSKNAHARRRLTLALLPLSPAAPAFQMTRYYRYGELDTCDGRWAAIWACMDRSKRYVRLDRRRKFHCEACPSAVATDTH